LRKTFEAALAGHHVFVEVGRAADGLAGVADDEIEAVACGKQMTAEGFDAGSVAEIKAEDFEAVRPGIEIGLSGVAGCGVARETSGDDEMRARPQEFDARLIADFNAPTGKERDTAREVGEFRALAEVEFRAGGAELVIEMMNDRVVALADIAVLRLAHFADVRPITVGVFGEFFVRSGVGAGEDGFATESADAGLGENGLVFLNAVRALFSLMCFEKTSPFDGVAAIDLAGGLEEFGAGFGGKFGEEGAVLGDGLEEFGGGEEADGEG
jgi:hypothetical protein